MPIGAPANHGKLIANLVERRPDVVEELNFYYRLQAARSHARRPAHDVGFGQRRIEDALAAVLRLQARSQLENAAFALDLLALEIFLATAVGHVFAENDDALIAFHLVLQAGINEIGHGLIRALGLRLGVRSEEH